MIDLGRTLPLPETLRLIATDLDGTIIPHGSGISPRTVRTLDAAQQLGIHVVYVTGRPPRWLTPVLEATGHAGHAICANGSVTLDLADGAVVARHAIEPETVVEVAARLRAEVPDVRFAVETVEGVHAESDFGAARSPQRHEGLAPRSTRPLRDAPQVEELLDGGPVIKMIALSPASSPDSLLAVGRRLVSGLVTTTHSSARDALLELGPLGVTKATSLAELARGWGIGPHGVVAFGDMPNDEEMLRWAEIGYAMDGGHPEAIAAADHVAPPATEDGVAQVIEPYLARLRRLGA